MYSFLRIDSIERMHERKKNEHLFSKCDHRDAYRTSMCGSWMAEFLLVQGSIFMISGSIGIWLFYVQHTFEDSYFEEDKEWQYVLAAVEGSSFYKLPKIMQFLTGNIGYHHVHHLSPRVPNYKLEEAHKNTEPLQNVPTISLATSLKSLRFKLWDEDNKTFVSFRGINSTAKSKAAIRLKPT